MAKKVLYVAIDRVSHEIFKFNNWKECQSLISGKNFSYKGFAANELDKVDDFINANTMGINEEKFNPNIKDMVYAYTDGSRKCNKDNKCIAYSYGCCIVKNGEIIAEFSESFDDEYNDMFQIMGELRGALKAIKYANEHSIKEIYLIYDYEGVEKFATGGWKSKKEIVKDYYKIMQKYMKEIKINFVKVKSHVKEKQLIHILNDKADELANKALENI